MGISFSELEIKAPACKKNEEAWLSVAFSHWQTDSTHTVKNIIINGVVINDVPFKGTPLNSRGVLRDGTDEDSPFGIHSGLIKHPNGEVWIVVLSRNGNHYIKRPSLMSGFIESVLYRKGIEIPTAHIDAFKTTDYPIDLEKFIQGEIPTVLGYQQFKLLGDYLKCVIAQDILTIHENSERLTCLNNLEKLLLDWITVIENEGNQTEIGKKLMAFIDTFESNYFDSFSKKLGEIFYLYMNNFIISKVEDEALLAELVYIICKNNNSRIFTRIQELVFDNYNIRITTSYDLLRWAKSNKQKEA